MLLRDLPRVQRTSQDMLQKAKELLSKGKYAEADAELNGLEKDSWIRSSDDELLSLRMKIIIKMKSTPEVLSDAKNEELTKSKFIASRVLESWVTSGFTNPIKVMQQDVNTVIKVNKDMLDAFELVYDATGILGGQDSESTEKKLTEEKLDKALVLLKNPIISRHCGQLYFGVGSYQKAVAELLVAIQKDDKDIKMNFFLGASYAELKEYKNAEKYLFKGMSLDVFKQTLHLEDYDLMKKHWVACQEEKGRNLDFYAQYAYSCLKVGKFQEAVDHYAVAIWLGAAKETKDIDLYRKKRVALVFLGRKHLLSSLKFQVACIQFIELCFPETDVKKKIHKENYRLSVELTEQGQREYKAGEYIASLAFFFQALCCLVPTAEWEQHFSKEECYFLQISSQYLYFKDNQDEKTIVDSKDEMQIDLNIGLQLLVCKIKEGVDKQIKRKAHLGLGQYRDELNQFYAKAMLEKEKAERSAQQALQEQANKEKLLETAKKRQEEQVKKAREKEEQVKKQKNEEEERKRIAEENAKKDAEMKAAAIMARKARKAAERAERKKANQLAKKAQQQGKNKVPDQKQEPKSENVIGSIFPKGLFSHARDDAKRFHQFVNDVFIFYNPSEHTKTMVWHFLKVELKENSAFDRIATMLRDFFSLDKGESHFAMFVELGLMKKFFPDVLTGDQITALQKIKDALDKYDSEANKARLSR